MTVGIEVFIMNKVGFRLQPFPSYLVGLFLMKIGNRAMVFEWVKK